MKKIAIALLILIFNCGFAQVENPFFEQIAFDLYKNTIIKKYPSEKKIRIAKYTLDLHPTYYTFQVSECLTGEFLDEKKNLEIFSIYALGQMDFDAPTHVMDFDGINKKQFRVKKSKTVKYPYLQISQPYHKKDNFEEFYVNVIEYHKKWSITYFVKIDKKGNVMKWCRDKSIIVTQYHG
jgi:hypothetical protein